MDQRLVRRCRKTRRGRKETDLLGVPEWAPVQACHHRRSMRPWPNICASCPLSNRCLTCIGPRRFRACFEPRDSRAVGRQNSSFAFSRYSFVRLLPVFKAYVAVEPAQELARSQSERPLAAFSYGIKIPEGPCCEIAKGGLKSYASRHR
jgi:hypothetical protein